MCCRLNRLREPARPQSAELNINYKLFLSLISLLLLEIWSPVSGYDVIIAIFAVDMLDLFNFQDLGKLFSKLFLSYFYCSTISINVVVSGN